MSAVRHLLGRADLIDDGAAMRFDIGHTAVAVVRIGDRFYALGDRCTHADVSLAGGEVDVHECTIECPKHGSAFDLATGDPLSLPATRPVPVYDVEVVGGELWLEVS